jgi:hypothetical protein
MSDLRENWAEDCSGRHGGSCGCRRCWSGGGGIDRMARTSLSAALAHAQQGRFETDMGAEAQTAPQRLTLPGTFLGWGAPVPIRGVLASIPPSDFAVAGRKRLYRIAKRGEASPLYIGMVVGPKASVASRVASHVGHLVNPHTTPAPKTNPAPSRSEIGNLRVEIGKELAVDRSLSAITVQIGVVNSGTHTLDNKLLHSYEAALQVLEHPKTYVGSVWTFEEEGL